MTVLTERLEHVHSASLGVWSTSGSRSDPPGREGITHFLEHMLFKGTAARSALQIGEAIDDIGGHVNGMTDREHLHLFARTGGEYAEKALGLLLDLLLQSRCAQKEVARERDVVLQEIARVRDSAQDWVHELVPQTAWADHPLGRPLMGTEASIRDTDQESLRQHLTEQLHVADRLVVTAVGRVDHERIVTLVEGRAGHLRRRPAGPDPGAPSFHAERVVLDRAGEQMQLCLVYPGIAWTDEARHTLAVLDTLLGGGSSSRLFQEIREKRGLAYSIESYPQSCEAAGLFVISAGTPRESFQVVVDLVEHEIARLQAERPAEAEVARAKVQLNVGLALAAENSTFRMQHIALSEIYWGRVLSFEEVTAGVERVTAEDVHRLVGRTLGSGQRAMVAIGPCGSEGDRHG